MSLEKVDFAPVLIGLLITLFVAELLGPLAVLITPWLQNLTWPSDYLTATEMIRLYLEGLYVLIGALVAGKKAGSHVIFAGVMVGLLYVLLYRLIPPLTVRALSQYFHWGIGVVDIPIRLRVAYLIMGTVVGLLGSLLAKVRFSVRMDEI